MKVFVRYKTALYLTKTFVVEALYYCNLLCYMKWLTSLLTFEALAVSLYHIKIPLVVLKIKGVFSPLSSPPLPSPPLSSPPLSSPSPQGQWGVHPMSMPFLHAGRTAQGIVSHLGDEGTRGLPVVVITETGQGKAMQMQSVMSKPAGIDVGDMVNAV